MKNIKFVVFSFLMVSCMSVGAMEDPDVSLYSGINLDTKEVRSVFGRKTQLGDAEDVAFRSHKLAANQLYKRVDMIDNDLSQVLGCLSENKSVISSVKLVIHGRVADGLQGTLTINAETNADLSKLYQSGDQVARTLLTQFRCPTEVIVTKPFKPSMRR